MDDLFGFVPGAGPGFAEPDALGVSGVSQSVEQLRSIRPLSLDTPPMIVPISFAGVEVNEDGLIAEKDLMDLLREKIDALDKIVDEYTEEELADVA